MSGRQVRREAGWERVAYDVMRPKALWKRDEMVGAGAEAEGGRESEAEGIPLTEGGEMKEMERGVASNVEKMLRWELSVPRVEPL